MFAIASILLPSLTPPMCMAHPVQQIQRNRLTVRLGSSNCLLQHTRSFRRKGRHCNPVQASGVYQPFPFNEHEYYKAHLQLVQATDPVGRPEGNLVFMKEGENVYMKDKKALVLSVGGDTLAGIANNIQRRDSDRPLALDLLWKVLTRGQEISKKDWKLVRVAIVDLRNNVYYGRLFFGESGSDGDKIVWDCDCRPSDACWLSLKAECPIYIKHDVFEAHAVRLTDLMSTQEESAIVTAGTSSAYMEAIEEDTGTALLTKIRKNDPDQIKRLKREMEVALSEEDYAAAVRIRDHPFMKLHLSMLQAQKDGNHEEALQLEEQLHKAIKESEERANKKK